MITRINKQAFYIGDSGFEHLGLIKDKLLNLNYEVICTGCGKVYFAWGVQTHNAVSLIGCLGCRKVSPGCGHYVAHESNFRDAHESFAEGVLQNIASKIYTLEPQTF